VGIWAIVLLLLF